MLIECFAILALILAIFVIYLRMKKTRLAWSILPLGCVPLTHVIAQLLLIRLAPVIGVDGSWIVTIADIVALAASALFCGSFSYFYGKKARVTYLIVVGLFNVILACILIANLKTP